MVRTNVPTSVTSSQNRPRATTNSSRLKASSKNVAKNTSTRKTPVIPTTGTNNNLTPTISGSTSGKERLLMEIIPFFEQYQKFCDTAALFVNDDENENNDSEDTTNHNNTYIRLQLRDSLTSKVISICNMSNVVSDMKHLSMIEENDNESIEPKPTLPSKQSSTIECFVHILNSAIAHLVSFTSNGRNTSSVAPTAILELLVSVAITWDKDQQNQVDDIAMGCINCVQTILPLLIQYSACQNDLIRIVAVRALCALAECLGSCPTTDDTLAQESLERLDSIQQAILPRFTDKAIAVRCAVVKACFASSNIESNPLCTDPDILQAVQWIVQHDPSPINRMIAIQHVPINRTTIEYLIPRIRDTKMNVRIAAIHALSKAVDHTVVDDSDPLEFIFPSRHIAEIVTTGYTDRCEATKEAVRRMVCTSWIKAAKYDPITFFRWLNVMDHPTVATTILHIWSEVSKDAPQWLQDDLPEVDQERFRNALKDCINQFTVSDIALGNWEEYTEKIFIARNLLHVIASDYEKDMLWSQLVPDVPALCQVLDTLSAKLVELVVLEIEQDQRHHDDAPEHEDKMIFLCLELLQLASVNASSMEEGSRRVMAGTIQNLLSNIATPDDLLEGCLSTFQELLLTNESVETSILPVIQHLSDVALSSENELFQVHTSKRIVLLVTLTLEKGGVTSDTAIEATKCFFHYVRPVMSHENQMLRQAAVRAMGLLGTSTTSELFIQGEDFTSVMVGISCDDDEEIEIRIQAMFALTDWVMLQFRKNKCFDNTSVVEALCCQVDQLLQVPTKFNQGTVCCGAEIATKLLLTLFLDESTPSITDQSDRIRTWLARLVLLYFDNENLGNNDDDDVTQVGHPLRLQQLLSVFFPAFTTSGILTLSRSSSFLIESITPMLKMSALQQINKKRSSKATVESVRWIRSIDFITSNVCKSRSLKSEILQMRLQSGASDSMPVMAQLGTTDDEGEYDESTTESTPGLMASVQVATFLSDQGQMVGAVISRALCKWIANQSSCLHVEKELWEDLSRFKGILEELVENEGIEDSASRRILEPVLQMLRCVDSDTDAAEDEVEESDEDDDVASLSNAIGSVDIRGGTSVDENARLTTAVASTPSAAKYPSEDATTIGLATLSRNQRRLRPSN